MDVFNHSVISSHLKSSEVISSHLKSSHASHPLYLLGCSGHLNFVHIWCPTYAPEPLLSGDFGNMNGDIHELATMTASRAELPHPETAVARCFCSPILSYCSHYDFYTLQAKK